MYKEALRPVWAEIDLNNLRYNIKNIAARVKGNAGNTEIIGVIKADAYGHGAIRVAQALREAGVKTFAVATLHEAIALREEGGMKEEIIILSLTPDMYAEKLVEYCFTPVVCDSANARVISEAALAAGTKLNCFIAADTGMGRIGYMTISDEDIAYAVSDIKKITELPGLSVSGLFSHMSTADMVDKTYSHEQEERFARLYNALRGAQVPIGKRTFASSAATIDLHSTHFEAIRPGIILYGLYPSGEVNKEEIDIRPVMSVKANIVLLKDVPTGFSVGYGRKFIAERPSKIATISLGYADGISRAYSSEGRVIVRGKYVPIAGNICMDQMMLDVTDVPGVKQGDEVIIMGTDGNLTVTAEEIAEKVGTINYEIICSFGQRLPKVYIE